MEIDHSGWMAYCIVVDIWVDIQVVVDWRCTVSTKVN